MRTSQRRIIVYVLAVALVVTTVAYAVMQTTLNVSGVVVKKGATLDIYFDNLQTPILTGNGKSNSTNLSSTTFNFSIELSEPNDSVKYYLDIVNDDEVNAKLEDVVIEGANDLVSRNIELIFTYADDKPVQAGDYLPAGTRKNLKVHILYSNVDSIYSDDANLSLNIKLVYTQYDGDIPSGGGDSGTSNKIIAYCNNSCVNSFCSVSEMGIVTGSELLCKVTLASYETMSEDYTEYFYAISGGTSDGGGLMLLSEKTSTNMPDDSWFNVLKNISSYEEYVATDSENMTYENYKTNKIRMPLLTDYYTYFNGQYGYRDETIPVENWLSGYYWLGTYKIRHRYHETTGELIDTYNSQMCVYGYTLYKEDCPVEKNQSMGYRYVIFVPYENIEYSESISLNL